jgi:hypothetical protein
MSYGIHPYEELVIKQRLNPAIRPEILLREQTAPVRPRVKLATIVSVALQPLSRLGGGGRRQAVEPCPAC